MKRLFSNLSAFFSVLLLMLAPAVVQAAPFWIIDISKPAAQNARTFNVQYTVLSTETDSFTVKLYQSGNATPLQTELDTNAGDPNAFNGNSGMFSVTVPADGDYVYYLTASRIGSTDLPQTTPTITVHVDTTAPAAPTYHGKTQSGNSYSLSFTAPADSDVKDVQIFASTNTSYQAGDSTRVGDIIVTPNQVVSFGYTAPDGATRYFALEAFDSAGNGSAIVGDPNIVVSTLRVLSSTSTPPSTTASGLPVGSETTLGTTATTAGVVATGNVSTTPKPEPTVSGNLGTQVGKVSPASNISGWWLAGGILLIAMLGGASYFIATKRSAKNS